MMLKLFQKVTFRTLSLLRTHGYTSEMYLWLSIEVGPHITVASVTKVCSWEWSYCKTFCQKTTTARAIQLCFEWHVKRQFWILIVPNDKKGIKCGIKKMHFLHFFLAMWRAIFHSFLVDKVRSRQLFAQQTWLSNAIYINGEPTTTFCHFSHQEKPKSFCWKEALFNCIFFEMLQQ